MIIYKICTRINSDNKLFHCALHFPFRLLRLDLIGSFRKTANVYTLNESLFVTEHFLTEKTFHAASQPSQCSRKLATPRGNVPNDYIVCSMELHECKMVFHCGQVPLRNTLS